MHVRLSTIDDIEKLTLLFDRYRSFYGKPSNKELAKSFLIERFQHMESIIFVADSEGDFIGFTQLYPSFSSVRASRSFILNDLFVTPEARGKGAGKALITAAANYGRAMGAVRLSLSTARDNHVAQSLYENAGWSRDDIFLSYNLDLL
ncbi:MULTISPECIES: GNAT family N-acetyltransferase [unclassified Sphingopyxis]|jgi:GNAT superfamily N-acetyltransferase|uniref:GNAT family N-acetyltransferase n=1 Tax=unclassified Sphingopyxis TaxID=2614943 RepID=UPI0009E7012B|nr:MULTISPECIES: GNAT family N-acetyltransferase [unclassified Sphingopyxis]